MWTPTTILSIVALAGGIVLIVFGHPIEGGSLIAAALTAQGIRAMGASSRTPKK